MHTGRKVPAGLGPVPFIFPESSAECYVDEILWATKVAIEAAAGVEREVARGASPAGCGRVHSQTASRRRSRR